MIKTLLRKDLDPERRRLFASVLRANRPARWVHATTLRLPVWAANAVCLLYAILESHRRMDSRRGQPVAIFKSANEESRLRGLGAVLTPFDFKMVRWSTGAAARALSLMHFVLRAALHPRQARRLVRVVGRLNRRYPLYAAMRAAEFLLLYGEFRRWFLRARPAVVMVSTDGNPVGLAALQAAHACGVPSVFAAHGALSAVPSRLRTSLALLFGEASRAQYLRQGSVFGRTLLYGFNDSFAAVAAPVSPTVRNVCVCLSKDSRPETVRALVQRIAHELGPARITVRPHPHSVVPRSHFGMPLSRGTSLHHDLQDCDLAIAGNSTVHLEILLTGVPSLYHAALDPSENPVLEFIHDQVVLAADDGMNLNQVRQTALHEYSRDEWRARFFRFINARSSNAEFSRQLDGILQEWIPESRDA